MQHFVNMCNRKQNKQEKKIHSIIQLQIKVTRVLLRKMANERAREEEEKQN
jgi:hypothetical protein